MYDFKKQRIKNQKVGYYRNPYFKRGRMDLLPRIKRQTHRGHPKRNLKSDSKLAAAWAASSYPAPTPGSHHYQSKENFGKSHLSSDNLLCLPVSLLGQKQTFSRHFAGSGDGRLASDEPMTALEALNSGIRDRVEMGDQGGDNRVPGQGVKGLDRSPRILPVGYPELKLQGWATPA